jgi:hypothetical protein
MDLEGSLSFWQKPATCSCPKPDESSQGHSYTFSVTSTLIIPYHLRLGLQSGIFPLGVPTFIALVCYPSQYAPLTSFLIKLC